MNDEENHWKMDWRKLFAILMTIAGVVGSLAALFYIWFMQMLLRYARDSLWDGIWFFAICFAGLIISILVGYLGVRMLRKSNT